MTINAWVTYIVGGLFLILLGALAVMLVINADQRATLAADDAAKNMLQSQNREWARKTAATDAALAKIKAADTANALAIAKAEHAAAAAEKKLQDEAAAIGGFQLDGADCESVLVLRQAYLAGPL